MSNLRIRTLTAAAGGTIAQALGLAHKIAALGDGEVLQNTVTLPAAAALLPPSIAAALQLPKINDTTNIKKTDIIVGCGGKAQAAVLMLQKQYGAFAVCVQRPSADEKCFDAIVAPQHDYNAAQIEAISNNPQTNAFLTLGAVGGVDAKMLAARRDSARQQFAAYHPPFVAALIGGANRSYLPQITQLISQLKNIATTNKASLLITPSPRTSDNIRQALQEAFGAEHYVWNGKGANPYLDIMAAADELCVTADSVNMISEACATSRPLYILPLSLKNGWRAKRGAQKFARFHEQIIAEQRAAFWHDETTRFIMPESLSPLDETTRAANWVWKKYCAR
ncbi:MAG: mitochondrial fission ELM1 family protein [Gammaproteobacteria bacterium WSBS_2016_MAG_OTU1]